MVVVVLFNDSEGYFTNLQMVSIFKEEMSKTNRIRCISSVQNSNKKHVWLLILQLTFERFLLLMLEKQFLRLNLTLKEVIQPSMDNILGFSIWLYLWSCWGIISLLCELDNWEGNFFIKLAKSNFKIVCHLKILDF